MANHEAHLDPESSLLDQTIVVEQAIEDLRKRREEARMDVRKSLDALRCANQNTIHEYEILYLRAVAVYEGFALLLKGLAAENTSNHA